MSRSRVRGPHRTIVARKLYGLEDAIGMTVLDPLRDERGWAFREGDGFSCDPIDGSSVTTT
jgi:putative glutathione S-transferase